MSKPLPVTIIAAVARNRVIGVDNELPWRLPRDLAFFRLSTIGHCLIMGRRTWESLPGPLGGRTHIVLSRQPRRLPRGVLQARSIEEALARVPAGQIPFIAGGAEIYRLALPIAERMLLTVVDAEVSGDTVFPEYDEDEWELVGREDFPPDEENTFGLSFRTYRRAADGV